MRDEILMEIRNLAAKHDGQAPGQKLFAQETGIKEHQWRGRYWARWGDALADAGFAPNKWNARRESDAILVGVALACRHYARLPTMPEIELYRRENTDVPTPKTIRRHFGNRESLIASLKNFANDHHDFSDIAGFIPDVRAPVVTQATTGRLIDGFVYLIQSGDFYKIGRSDDIERRVKEIRIALPEKAALIHAIRTDDPAGIEAYWHQRFGDRRASGEWFRLTARDVAAFRKRKFQ